MRTQNFEFCGSEKAAALVVASETGDIWRRTRSEIYLALLPVVNSGQCRLLDNARLVTQLVGLERRTSRAGKDSVDHRVDQHDDLANAVAGVLTLVAARGGTNGWVEYLEGVFTGKYPEEPEQPKAFVKQAQPVPSPEPVATEVETRPCTRPECNGTMRERRPHEFCCASCGHVLTVSAIITQSPSRGEYLRSADARVLGKGSFGRFGR